MERIVILAAGMLAIAAVTVSCGSSSDSALATAHASPAQASASPAVSSSSSSQSASAQASSSSGPASNGSSSSSSSNSSASSSSSAAGAAGPPVLTATVDFGIPAYEPDVPSWPTQSCQKTPYGQPENGLGSAYMCLFSQSPTSLNSWGVGYQYVTGNSGAYHALYVGGDNNGLDLGVAKGGTSSEALDSSGTGAPDVLTIGFGDAADGVTHALYWPHDVGSATILPLPPGADPRSRSEAHAVNYAGEIVGLYWVANDPKNVGTRAVLWEPAASAPDGSGYLAYDLTSLLPASASGLVLATAYAFDCAGDIVADGTPADGQHDPEQAALTNQRYLILRQAATDASQSGCRY